MVVLLNTISVPPGEVALLTVCVGELPLVVSLGELRSVLDVENAPDICMICVPLHL